ncbi:hypothetical protein SAMN05421820_101163 [Pedobacter steynii]|uniref:Uncharacterized protein n=1 Tax=Pedobacter steynii TaxID=430522 RepID=A0A1G9J647_9SPHI|nr:hypothetical protein SAMN05421820_101163 [Pedobacter steynii]
MLKLRSGIVVLLQNDSYPVRKGLIRNNSGYLPEQVF